MKMNSVQWGKFVGEAMLAMLGNDPFRIAQACGWQVIIEQQDSLNYFLPRRVAVWEGDKRIIRIFSSALRRIFIDEQFGLRLVCSHEVFHGLHASGYKLCQAISNPPPQLTRSEQEQAAEAFALTLLSA
ncbi:hypothetical protein KJ068_01415 [bacterium]|nr:hypothetical protein [bacterium]